MKYLNTIRTVAAVVIFAFLAALPANAENIKVTPLGSHNGEFCYMDRALILEDPDGTRILYDPGRTVAGADDPRLGKIDVVLVTHMHGDHVGDKHILKVNAGDCDKPRVSENALPNTNAVNIALDKDALILTGREMSTFFQKKLVALGGEKKEEYSQPVNFGASYIKIDNPKPYEKISHKVGSVAITTVPATHPNGVEGNMIGGVAWVYAKRSRADRLCRTRNGLCADLFQRLGCVFVRGYRYHRGAGYSGSPTLWGEIGRDEYWRHIHHRTERSRLGHQRIDQTG